MWDRLYPYFLWIEQTRLGHAIRESKWTFTLAEVFHLLGLTLLLGTVLIPALAFSGSFCKGRVSRAPHVN